MLYLDHVGRGWVRVFSTKDDTIELQQFRCLVRAPKTALNNPRDNAKSRVHLTLIGRPAVQAAASIPKDRVFATPIERIAWENKQPAIKALWPEPFVR